MTASNSGLYKIQFYIRGIQSSTGVPLVLQIQINNVALAIFLSGLVETVAQQVDAGQFITSLAAGNVITLVNITHTSTATITLPAEPQVVNNINAYLLVEHIAV
jgi:hypothetical protein